MDLRAVGVAWLVISLLACGFDTSGLRPPPGPDLRADLQPNPDLGTDLPRDGQSPRPEQLPDGVPPREAMIDLGAKDLPPPDQPKPSCTVDPSICQKQTPICDGSCRACRDHAECAGGLCLADGSCPDPSSISFVDDDCTPATVDGSKSHPYCKINDAVGKSPLYILVRAGTYSDDAIINKSKEVYGEAGAVLTPTACDKIVLDGKITALLAGFEIHGNVLIKGGVKAALLQNQIGPSSCIGVNATGSEATLERNLIFGHTGGGVILEGKYTARNNMIVKNGKAELTWGAVKLGSPDPAALFINNTIANNLSKGSNDKEGGGVRCESNAVTAKLENTIFWGNTFNDTGKAANDRQYGPDCKALHSLEELKPGAVAGSTNISLDPQFTAIGVKTAAPYYRLTSGSPAKNKGTAVGAPSVDYDGEPRDQKPDIGADEIFP